MAKPKMTAEQERIALYRKDPRIFVREQFGVEPDAWQDSVLEAFPHNQRIALQACKGPGKTTVLAWLGWNFLATRPSPNIAATSISGDQLRDGLWKEMAKWQAKSPFLRDNFVWTTTRIAAKQTDLAGNWWMSARTWPKTGNAEEQANTLAGLHSDYMLFLLDESGSIPDSVMAAAEAALASCVEGHIVQAGNPTNLSGPLYRAATSEKDLWWRKEITGDPDDPERASRVHIDWARQQIEKYGAEHPFVLVNVFGRFPPTSLTALIGPDEVRAAMRRWYRPLEIGNQAKIMGIDVARQGDDASVIAMRHGPQMHNLRRYRNVPDGVTGASIANRHWNEFDADACFVDATGGLGFTWIDQLNVLGKASIPVQFNSKASVENRYANRRAEMYFLFVDWIKAGGALPPEDQEGSRELLKALTETVYTFKNDRLMLEDKDDIKRKLGFSPDEADACALTFAEPVTPKSKTARATVARSAMGGHYNPFADIDRISGQSPQGAVTPYDPFNR